MNFLNVQEDSSRPSLFSSIWSLQVQMQNETNPLTLEMPALFSAGGSQQSLPSALSGALDPATESGVQLACAHHHQHHLHNCTAGGASSSEMFTVHNSTSNNNNANNDQYYVSQQNHSHHPSYCDYCGNINSGCGAQNFRSVKSLSDLKTLTASPSVATVATHGFNYLPMAGVLNVSPMDGSMAPILLDNKAANDASGGEQIPSTSALAYSAANAPSNHYPMDSAVDGTYYNDRGGPYTYSNGAGFCAPGFGAGISRQQRNSNVCAWLQKLSITDNGSGGGCGVSNTCYDNSAMRADNGNSNGQQNNYANGYLNGGYSNSNQKGFSDNPSNQSNQSAAMNVDMESQQGD